MCIFNLQISGTAFNHYWVMKYIDPWCGSYMCGINNMEPIHVPKRGDWDLWQQKKYTVNGCFYAILSFHSVKRLIFPAYRHKDPKINRNIRSLPHIIWRKDMVESPIIAKASIMVQCANYFIIFQETSEPIWEPVFNI